MTDDPLEERVAAVERAIGEAPATDGTAAPGALGDRVAALEDDVAELEAAVQAIRGYVGGVKHVNDEVEQRAEAALAKAEAVEHALEAGRGREPGSEDRSAAAGVDPVSGRRDDRGPTPGRDRNAARDENTQHRASAGARRGDSRSARPTPGRRPFRARDDRDPQAPAERCPQCGGPSPEDPGDADGVSPPGAPLAGDGPVPDGLGERTLAEQEDDGRDGWLARLREVL